MPIHLPKGCKNTALLFLFRIYYCLPHSFASKQMHAERERERERKQTHKQEPRRCISRDPPSWHWLSLQLLAFFCSDHPWALFSPLPVSSQTPVSNLNACRRRTVWYKCLQTYTDPPDPTSMITCGNADANMHIFVHTYIRFWMLALIICRWIRAYINEKP